jgi:hypothetical protein
VTRERWRVDELEGELAVVEAGGRRFDLPRALLPSGAREDCVLDVRVAREDDDRSVVTIAVDPEATAAARRRSAGVLDRLAGGDPGGDVVL